MTLQTVNSSEEKLRELVLYICRRSEGDERFGATKLNKLLWLSDFSAYLTFGHPITGQEYQALEQGPAPRRLLPIMERMANEGEIATRPQSYYGFSQKKTFALREPDITKFGPEEIDLVNRLIAEWWGKNAAEISEASHGFVGWQLAEKGETIPYNVALLCRRELTKHEQEIAQTLERSLSGS